jgi:ethylbenzene dioxygenase beta subunit
VHSVFQQVRNRNDRDEMVLNGRRRDIWRAKGDGFELAARLILVSQSVLLTRNLSAFF